MKHFTTLIIFLLISCLKISFAQDTSLVNTPVSQNDSSANIFKLEQNNSDSLILTNKPIIKTESNTSSVDTIETNHTEIIKQDLDSLRNDTTLFSAKNLFTNIENTVPDKPKEVLEVISLSKIFWTIVILFLGYYFIQLIIKILDIFSERSARFRITIKGIIPIFRILTWSIIIFAIIKGIYDPPFETVIAFTASVGIAVGLAAQDLLKNVFGGMALILDRPFKVGDKIDSGKYYGEVIEIGLRATRLVTADDSVVSVPNAELVNSSVSNANSGELNCPLEKDDNKPPLDAEFLSSENCLAKSSKASP